LTDRKLTGANSTYKKLAVQWLNEHLCFVSSSVVADSLVLRNPPDAKPENVLGPIHKNSFMVDDFKKSKYFNYLLKNLKELEKERINFNEEVLGLLNRKTDEFGFVLKCHLIIEYYIDSYLKTAYPSILNWQSSRLTFSQKLELINNNRTPIGVYYQGIKCLNSIRNKFSHRISYVIEKKDYKEIEEIMTIWKNASNEPVPEGLALIESFTLWVCGNIDGMINGINRTNSLGLSAYLKWLEDMQKVDG